MFLSWGHLGTMLGFVGSSWAYVGPSWDYVGPAWFYVGPSWLCVGLSWGYVAPSWGHVEGRKDLKVQKLYEHMFTTQFFTVFVQHSCSHYNAFGSITSQTRTYLRTWQHQMTTIMQPFQCDLQPQIPKHPITTHAQAHPKQLVATITMRQKKRETDRSRNRRTQEVPVIAGCSHFTRKNMEKRKVSCSGFLPSTNPMQHSCSHYNAFCNILFTTISLRHHFSSSPLPFVTTLCHSILLSIILLWCIVMDCEVSHRPSSRPILLWCILM